MDFVSRVYEVVRDLDAGEVVSYGEVAAAAGAPGAARAVGAALRDAPGDVPWWRVVRSDGRIVSPQAEEQEARLRDEGVPVAERRVRRDRGCS